MEKIARQSRQTCSTKIPRSAAINENDVMIIWVEEEEKNVYFYF